MKILLVTTGLGMGGAERQICDLADEFIRQGHSVTILCLNSRHEVSPKSTQVTLHSLSMSKTPWGMVAGLVHAQALILQIRPDVVHSHMFHANIFCRVLRIMGAIPKLICTAHSSNEGGLWRTLAYRITHPLANVNTIVSSAALRSFVNLGVVRKANKMVVIGNGIDTHRFKYSLSARKLIRSQADLLDDNIFILSIGRLEEPKDFTTLIKSFQLLMLSSAKSNQSFILGIIGQGSQLSELQQLVNSKGLGRQIQFLGVQHNIEQWLSACDIYVLSSKHEGLNVSIMEALACERTVVASDCEGVRELVANKDLIVPVGDSRAMAKALEQAASLSDCGTSRVMIEEHYSITCVVDKWLEVYER